MPLTLLLPLLLLFCLAEAWLGHDRRLFYARNESKWPLCCQRKEGAGVDAEGGRGKLGSTFWPIRATGHESAVSLPGLGLRQQQRSQRSEASLSCLAVSPRVASRQSKYLSSSIWNSVCHLTNVTGSSKQREWQEGALLESVKPLEKSESQSESLLASCHGTLFGLSLCWMFSFLHFTCDVSPPWQMTIETNLAREERGGTGR